FSFTPPCFPKSLQHLHFGLSLTPANPPATVSAYLARKAGGRSPRLGMAEIVNLRIARKRAARSKAEDRAAEQRLAHGVSGLERDRAAADRDKARQTFDQHRIE